jgi:hypothetical protein
MFHKTASLLSNILVKTASIMKNMTVKLKISYPESLAEIFKRYSASEVIEKYLEEKERSPSKKGSKMNLDSSTGPDHQTPKLK